MSSKVATMRAALSARQAALELPESHESITEDWIAEQFTRKVSGRYRYDATTGQWLMFVGSHWSTSERGGSSVYAHVVNDARAFLRDVAAEVRAQYKPTQTQPNAPVRVYGRDRTIRAVVNLTRDAPAIAVDGPAVFDRDPGVLATPGGIVDLRTGTRRPATPADMVSKLTTVAPDERTPEWWLRFLAECFPGDAEAVAYLQRVAGYMLTGEMKEEQFWYLFGSGGNGKGVFSGTLAHIMGDYATSSEPSTWAKRPDGMEPHKQELAVLQGARLIEIPEPDGGRLNESRVKQWTGRNGVRANLMRQNSAKFMPVGKLLFSANHAPTFTAVDDAIRRRLRVVPFNTKPAHPDPDLPERLRAEAGGILQWAIDGAALWYRDGLGSCALVDGETADQFCAQDDLGAWIAERCEQGGEYRTLGKLLRDDYLATQERNGVCEYVSPQKFHEELRKRGFGLADSNAGRCVQGLALKG